MKNKILLINNITAPYRLPLFEALNKKQNIEVGFIKKNDKERLWQNRLKEYVFSRFFLEDIKLNERLKKSNYNILIIGENPESMNTLIKLFIYSKMRNKKFIIWQGETKPYSFYTKNPIKLLIEKLYRITIYPMADAFISYSKETDKFLWNLGVKKEKIFTGTQVMPKELLPNPTKKDKPKEFKDKKIFLYLGYLRKGKGLDVLINAFNQIKSSEAILLIVGAGDEEKSLKELAKDNKNIIFKPYAEGIEKANHYSQSDCFILPTNHDVWGHVITESLYYNLPVISTDAAAASELIENGKNGYIIPTGNVSVLKDKIEFLIKNQKKMKEMKENIKKSDKCKLVDIKYSVKTFEDAIKYVSNKK